MPQPGTKRAPSEPQQSPADVPTAAAVLGAFEQICVAMSAAGAFVAIRDLEGIRSVVSYGNAPGVGTRLPLDSAFVNRCIETGEVVFRDVTSSDSRARAPIAQSLNWHAAVAVPLQAQGMIVGLIALFSSQPSAIASATVTELQAVAEMFAALIIFDAGHGGQPVVGGPPDRPIVLPRQVVDQESVPAGVGNEAIEQLRGHELAKAQPSSFWNRFRNPATRRALIAGIAFVLCLALLLLLLKPRHKELSVSIHGANSPTAERPKNEPSSKGSRELSARDKTGRQTSPAPQVSSPSGLPLSTDLPSTSKPHRSRDNVHATEPSAPHAALSADDNTSIASTASSQNANAPAGIRFALKPPKALADQKASDPISPGLSMEASALAPSLLADASPAPVTLGSSAPLATPIKPLKITPPAFVLDRTVKGHSDWVTGVSFSPHGQLASSSWDQTVKFWDALTGKQLNGVSGKLQPVQALAFSRDGRWLAAENSSNSVAVWDTATGREILTLPSDKPPPALHRTWVYSIAFSPDGRELASGVDDQTVRVWDLSTGKKVRDLIGSHRSVIYIAFSPDGRFIASGDDDKTIQIWDASTGAKLWTLSGHSKPVFAVAFSPNGRLLASASGDKTIKFWDVATGRELRTLTGHKNSVTSLAFSPDGLWLASSSWDKTIKIWDVATGTALQTLAAHEHAIYSVAFDPHGKLLASGSQDGTVDIWRLGGAANRTSASTTPATP
jgi:WD40 repeat protein